MAELVKALDEKKLVKGIKSLVYKKIKAIKINQLGKPYNIQESPIPAYHLLEIEKYLPSIPFYSETEQIGLDYTFTRGCPFNCSFCSNKVLQQNRVYRYKSSNKVVEELSILKRKYKFSYIYLEDDNPLVNIKNFLETAKQFMKRDLNISYLAGCRVDTIVGASFEDLKIMRDSGWRETIIGAESGSNKILNYLNKGINVEQTLQAAKILNKLGVWSAYNVMDCIPNETFRERRQTYDLMRKLKQIHPQSILVGPHHFRPFPGSELYQTCLKEKMIEPKTFRDWSNCDLFYTTSPSDLPWVKDYHKSEKIEMIFRVYGVGGLIARGLKSAFFHIRRRI